MKEAKSVGEAGPCHNCYHAVCPFCPKHCGFVSVFCKDSCFCVLNQPGTWFLIRSIFNRAALGLTPCPAFLRAVWESLGPLISNVCVKTAFTGNCTQDRKSGLGSNLPAQLHRPVPCSICHTALVISPCPSVSGSVWLIQNIWNKWRCC